MNIKIIPSLLNGTVVIPPSKSYAHRAIICASLANGKSTINNVDLSNDILATIEVLKNLGVKFEYKNRTLLVDSNKLVICNNTFYCNESGSTLRFIIPIALTIGKNLIFDGNTSLKTRPIWPFFKVFDKSNIIYDYRGELPLITSGKLKSGTYSITGEVSSQFFTGLIFGLSLLNEKSILNVEGKLLSRSYIDITLDVLNTFGANVISNNYTTFEIFPSTYNPCVYNIEGDFSQLAFYALAGSIGSEVTVSNLNFDTVQGDKELLDILNKLSVYYSINGNSITFKKSRSINTKIDISECPDLGPVIFCLGAVGSGTMIVTGIERLRIKESDRVSAMVKELNKLGANIEDCISYVKIDGVKTLEGGCVIDTYDDHRIAMCLSVLGSVVKNPVTINCANVVDKSYPSFYEDYKLINGKIKNLS